MDIDLGKLIREVEIRPALWDQRSVHHNNREIVQKLWAQVAFACRLPVELTRTKWKSLRDNFRQEIRKIQRGKYGDPWMSPSSHKSTWVWYPRLMFLKSQVPLYCNGSFSPPVSDCSSPACERPSPAHRHLPDTFYYDVNSVCDTVLEETTPENWDPMFHNNFQRFFRPLQSPSTRFIDTASEPGRSINIQSKRPKKKQCDETHMYLKSLLGPLKILPRHRQVHVLETIRELVQEQTALVSNKSNHKATFSN